MHFITHLWGVWINSIPAGLHLATILTAFFRPWTTFINATSRRGSSSSTIITGTWTRSYLGRTYSRPAVTGGSCCTSAAATTTAVHFSANIFFGIRIASTGITILFVGRSRRTIFWSACCLSFRSNGCDNKHRCKYEKTNPHFWNFWMKNIKLTGETVNFIIIFRIKKLLKHAPFLSNEK